MQSNLCLMADSSWGSSDQHKGWTFAHAGLLVSSPVPPSFWPPQSALQQFAMTISQAGSGRSVLAQDWIRLLLVFFQYWAHSSGLLLCPKVSSILGDDIKTGRIVTLGHMQTFHKWMKCIHRCQGSFSLHEVKLVKCF